MTAPVAVKYVDVSQRTFTIQHGSTNHAVSISPNLTKMKSDGTGLEFISPDMVVVEIVGSANLFLAPTMVVTRQGTNVVVTARYGIPLSSFIPVTIYARVTCVYWHSISGADHTI